MSSEEPRDPDPEGALRFDGLTIDLRGREAIVSGRAVNLTRREFELLLALAARPGVVVSRRDLLLMAWSDDFVYPDLESYATVTEHVHRLRAKLGPEWIRTYRGVGYRFEANPEPAE